MAIDRCEAVCKDDEDVTGRRAHGQIDEPRQPVDDDDVGGDATTTADPTIKFIREKKEEDDEVGKIKKW